MTTTPETLTTDLLQDFNRYFQDSITRNIQQWKMMLQMLGYHLGWNDPDGTPNRAPAGKQIRPLLALLSCGASQGDPQDALPLAAGIELLHNFSLIHDDVMDVSETRRGRTTVWSIWGVNQAINTGDGAYGLSFRLLADSAYKNPQTIVYAQRILSQACVDTVYGQMLDISFESRDDVSTDEYVQMVGLKTGPLLGAALAGGALFAGKSWEHAMQLDNIGREIGVVFQMQDDILGVWGESEKTGKSADDDLTAKKKSYPIIWALENLPQDSRNEISTLYQQQAPLPNKTTVRIRNILTDGSVNKAISRAIQARYEALILELNKLYPEESSYRKELLKILAFIINRTH